jgi:Fic family protein
MVALSMTNGLVYLSYHLTLVTSIGTYPHITFRQTWDPDVAHYELGQCEALIRAISNTPILPNYHQELKLISLTKGAQATTAIEGNTLTDEEVEQIAAGEELPPSKEYQQREIVNIITALNVLLNEIVVQGRTEKVSVPLLLRFHQMIGKDLGEHFDAVPGQFRRDSRIVGPYRTPHPEDVPDLVNSLCEFMERQFHYDRGQSFGAGIVQAIVAHVYIEWIHPFGDGNGRTGRLVEFYLLLRAGNPDIASHILSNFYNETRNEYYRQLHRANKNQNLTEFIKYAVTGFRDGLTKTLNKVQQNLFDITFQKHVYDQFKDRKMTKTSVFKRQRQLGLDFPLNRELTLNEIVSQNPETLRAYASLSPRTLYRDLELLESMNLIERVGDKWKANRKVLTTTTALRLERRRNNETAKA